MAEEHRNAVQRVVFGRQNLGFANAVPVERRTHERLGEIEIRPVVGPLTLSLHTCQQRIVAQSLFLEADFLQLRVSVHQIADNQHIFHCEIPVGILFLTGLGLALLHVVVATFVRHTIFLRPRHRLLVFVLVVDFQLDATQNFDQIGVFRTHSEVVLEEIGIDNRASNAHTGVSKAQIRLSTHHRHSLRGTGEAKNFLSDIFRNRVVVEVLHVVAIDAECGQTLLCVGGEHGSQIDGSRALRSVEAPHRLRIVRIHIHRFRAVAPARRHRNRRTDTLALELLSAGGTLGHAANRRVGNHTLHRTSVAVAHIAFNQVFHCLGQGHGLLFQTLAHATLTAVNGGANANFRVLVHILLILGFQKSIGKVTKKCEYLQMIICFSQTKILRFSR